MQFSEMQCFNVRQSCWKGTIQFFFTVQIQLDTMKGSCSCGKHIKLLLLIFCKGHLYNNNS